MPLRAWPALGQLLWRFLPKRRRWGGWVGFSRDIAVMWQGRSSSQRQFAR
ncbi:MAG: hypothetical protein R2865_06440 [Deinococcales bacterium]